jgi:hypothetical protein
VFSCLDLCFLSILGRENEVEVASSAGAAEKQININSRLVSAGERGYISSGGVAA